MAIVFMHIVSESPFFFLLLLLLLLLFLLLCPHTAASGGVCGPFGVGDGAQLAGALQGAPHGEAQLDGRSRESAKAVQGDLIDWVSVLRSRRCPVQNGLK